MNTFTVQPGGTLSGAARVPGDKSISHRSIMLGALAEGETRVSGFLEGADCLATLEAFRAMGVPIERKGPGEVVIQGRGLQGLRAPDRPLDMGNSGTAMRLLCGVLAGQSFDSELIGDESLTRRPMRRVTEPLARMGAQIETSEAGTPPLRIRGGAPLRGTDHVLEVASAQVKSAILLAGLWAEGPTCVTEPAPTRDHTERMLNGFGCVVTRDGPKACVTGGRAPAGEFRGCPGGHLLGRVFSGGSQHRDGLADAPGACGHQPDPDRRDRHPAPDGCGHPGGKRARSRRRTGG